MATSKLPRQSEDIINNVPDIVTHKILELLPIRMAARTSMLSKQWRHNWLSLKRLIFDADFCKKHGSEDCSNIISSILFHHEGPVHDFDLCIPGGASRKRMNVSQWISFLSKSEVTRIRIDNCSDHIHIKSHIFRCSELVHLELNNFYLDPPPTGFNGFRKLKHLLLYHIDFTRPDVFLNLMTNCRMLTTLKLKYWSGMDEIIINLPSIETLYIHGPFKRLAFNGVRSLTSLGVWLEDIPQKQISHDTMDAINLLAGSCQLRDIQFNGHLCKFLAAGGTMGSQLVTFNHLNKLRLRNLDLEDYNILRCVLSMLERCPYIKEFQISVSPNKNDNQRIELGLNLNNNLQMDQLREVKLRGITGSSVELKLIEYLLSISVVLENLIFRCRNQDADLQLKLLRTLTTYPKASPKARFLFGR